MVFAPLVAARDGVTLSQLIQGVGPSGRRGGRLSRLGGCAGWLCLVPVNTSFDDEDEIDIEDYTREDCKTPRRKGSTYLLIVVIENGPWKINGF